jgi:hypothetical protein
MLSYNLCIESHVYDTTSYLFIGMGQGVSRLHGTSRNSGTGPAPLSTGSSDCQYASSTGDLARHLSGQTTSEGDINTRPLVLTFLSPSCPLCASVKRRLDTAQDERYELLYLDASNTALWGPEIVFYSVDQVPCLVVVDRARLRSARGIGRGQASVIGKTVCVSSADRVQEALHTLLRSGCGINTSGTL